MAPEGASAGAEAPDIGAVSRGSATGLLNLPDELLEDVIGQSSQQTVLSLLSVCRHLFELARPILYRHPTVKPPIEAACDY